MKKSKTNLIIKIALAMFMAIGQPFLVVGRFYMIPEIELIPDPKTGILIPEQWRPVLNYEGLYEVSNYARIKHLKRIVYGTSWTGVVCKKEYKEYLKTSNSVRGGYLSLGMSRNGERKSLYRHRLVALAFVTNPDPINRIEVNHVDSDPFNNHAINLEWVTPIQNNHHACKRSYSENGGRHWKSKLSIESAAYIREHYKNPHSAIVLDKMFSIDISSVYDVLRGDSWRINKDDKIKIYKLGERIR